MASTKKMMKLGMFFMPCGHHISAWRHPDVPSDAGANPEHLIELAQLSEKGLFDLFFMGDWVTFWRASLDQMTHDSHSAWIEPFTVMALLSQHTKHIGLVCTSTSTYDTPYGLARRFASLDLLSGGRAGWNLVTSGLQSESQSFGSDPLPKPERYKRAREFAYICRSLWNSWGEGVFLRNKDTGEYFDKNKLSILEHKGEFYGCKGPLNVPPSPQGETVIIQAGSSPDGRDLAAAIAEVAFCAFTSIDAAKEYYNDVKGRAEAYGRDPSSMAVMPGLSVIVGKTKEEAEAKHKELQDLIDPETGLGILSDRLYYDLSGCDVDGPLPDDIDLSKGGSRAELLVNLGRENNMTIRQLYSHIADTRGHYQIVGTPTEVADMMETWINEGACDGFNIMSSLFPNSLQDFVDLVVPELQRRGIYRTEYECTTLRGNLGFSRPKLDPAVYNQAG